MEGPETTATEKPEQPGRTQLDIMPPDAPFEEGFSMKTLWAALFVGIVLLPGAIYMFLVTGMSISGSAEWVAIILFIEIAKRSFVRMRTQEIMILYWVVGSLIAADFALGAGGALFGGPFSALIWFQYFIQSPQAKGLAEHIPRWVVPSLGSEALLNRTFFHIDWLKPVLVLVPTVLLFKLNQVTLGYVLFRATSDFERLEFPLQIVGAAGTTALAETSAKQEGWRWRVFSTGTFIGVIWGLVYVVVPTLSGIFLTKTVQILPIPFIDLTVELKSLIPAAVIGIGTNLTDIFAGFYLPFWVVIGTFSCSILMNLVANPILYHYGVLHSWSPGMAVFPTLLANHLDFYLSFGIGAMLIVAVTGFAYAIKTILSQRRKRRHDPSARSGLPEPPKGRGDIKIWLALALWAAGTLCLVIMVHVLIPTFPWWIVAFFGFVWTPFGSYIGARMLGLTGSPYGSSIPFMKETSFYLSGYQGTAVWFAPIPLSDHSGAVGTYKQLELTKTRFSSYFKLVVVTMVIMLVCSFIFWSLVWKLAPIPSAAYPYVQKVWPIRATWQTLWVKSTLPGAQNLIKEFVHPSYILMGMAFSGALYGVLTAVKAPILIFYGFIAGINWEVWPHTTILQFTGAMLGRFYFAKKYGKDRWLMYAAILAAGYGCGMGLVGMISIAIALISKSVSLLVF